MMNCAINPYKSNKSGKTRHEIGGVIDFGHKVQRSHEFRGFATRRSIIEGKWHRPG